MDAIEVADRLEIQQQLANYAAGKDFQDWDLYASVFTEDADLDYTNYYTNALPLCGTPACVMAAFKPLFATMPWTQHYITNISYAFDASNADACQVRAYFHNACVLPGQVDLSHHYGYYDHRFLRTAAGWKSTNMSETLLQRESMRSAYTPAAAA